MKRYVGILRTGTCVLVEMMPIEGSDRCAVRLEGHALRATYTVAAMKETVSLQVGGVASRIALDDIIAERDEALRKLAMAEQETARQKERADALEDACKVLEGIADGSPT